MSIEAVAIRREKQRQGIGTLALHDATEFVNAQAVAAVTRHPALPRIMGKVFHIVSPDFEAPEPLYRMHTHPLVQHIAEVYAEHKGMNPREDAGSMLAIAVAKRRIPK